MSLSIDIKTFQNQLNRVARTQILKYPELTMKQRIKRVLKSIIKKEFYFKVDHYFWPNGLLAISLEYSHRLENKEHDMKQLEEYYRRWFKDGMKIKNADYAINGYSLIYLYKLKRERKYLEAIEEIANYVSSLERAKDGSIPYRKNNGEKVFVDLLGLTCPFLARYSDLKQNEEVLDLAIQQLKNFLIKGMDPETGLPYHAYDANDGTKLGIIGWGRGVGWLFIGLVDTLEYIPDSHKDYYFIKNNLLKLVKIIVKYQTAEGGYTWQLQAKEGNFDSSATSMINYALVKGIMLKIIPESYLENVMRDLNALYKVSNKGLVYHSSGECRGLSMYPQKYENNPWAQGPTSSLVSILLKLEL